MSNVPVEVWAEIDEMTRKETRQAGDIDTAMMATHLGISRNAAAVKMRQIADERPKKWEFLKVYDGELKREINVLRKLEPPG